MKRLVKYLFLIVAFAACKTQYPSPEASFPHLQISEGGGFTGAVVTHYILKNGQVFQANPNSATTRELNSIKKKEARKYLKSVKLATTGKDPIYEPDNIYRVLTYADKDTSYSVLWYRGRAELDSIYQSIMRDIEKANAQYK